MTEFYDISIIEILKTDKIKNFLNLEDNLFNDNSELFCEDETIYTIQYPNGKNASVSYGFIINIEKNDIKHTCNTDNGSSGSPILNISNNKLIGIHKEGSVRFNFNKGTFLKFPLNDFILKLNLKSSGKDKVSNQIESLHIDNESIDDCDFIKNVKKCVNIMISLVKMEDDLNDEILKIIAFHKNKSGLYDIHFRRWEYLSNELNSIVNKVGIACAYLQYYSFDDITYEKILKNQYQLVSKLFKLIEEIPIYFNEKKNIYFLILKILKNFSKKN